MHEGLDSTVAKLPRTILTANAYPTPLELADGIAPTLWLKRDDRVVGAIYGGNKVRKLEYLIGEARARGKTRLVTIGAVGSHQVVATAMYGRAHGFDVEAILVAQPASAHARANIGVALAHGLVPVAASSWSTAPALLASRWGRDAYVIPLGGSNPLGTVGFVRAATEIADAVREGRLAEPEAIVVALGSGGTAAGLALGLEIAGLRTRVVGIAVSHPVRMLRFFAERLAKQTASFLGLPRALGLAASARIEVDAAWLGRGYGHETEAGTRAIAAASALGLTLDPTYTAKAFAAASARAKAGATIVYWHTLSGRPTCASDPSDRALALGGEGALPPAIEALLE